MKKVFLISLISLAINSVAYAVSIDKMPTGFARNVIILIPDGMSQDGVTLTRWVYNDGAPLHMDEIASGIVRTHNSDTVIADSAPAGTAMATGHKTQDKLIGIKPAKATLYGANEVDELDAYAPVASVLELAKLQGRSTGIIATSEIMHATPAAFTAHSRHRGNYDDISEQQVYQNLNVTFGGGASFLRKENRKDSQDMLQILAQNGYQLVLNAQGMEQTGHNKVWGLFAEKDLPYDIDRKNEPSLAQMTSKAIDLLSKNQKGFLLMVEGSKVDWAAHDNAPVALMSDIKAFDDAVGVALEYAKSNQDTLVIVASDHGNGGLTMGNRMTTKDYSSRPLSDFVSHLRKITISEEHLAEQILADRENSAALLKENLNMDRSDPALAKIMRQTELKNIKAEIANWNNQQSYLGWTTGGHTGQEVTLFVYAHNPLHVLTGTVQNADIARYVAKSLDGDLEQASKALFVSSKSFPAAGIELKNNLENEDTVEFILTRNNQDYLFYKNRNYFVKNGYRTTFNGVVVFNGQELFVPQAALDMMS